jgi:hypothetical protein
MTGARRPKQAECSSGNHGETAGTALRLFRPTPCSGLRLVPAYALFRPRPCSGLRTVALLTFAWS